MKRSSKRNILVAAFALSLVAAVSIKPAFAYFTDTVTASKRVQVAVGADVPDTNDSVDGMVKTVSISNTGDYDLYIRVKAIYSSNYVAAINAASSAKWSLSDDGYYYYSDIVKAKTTSDGADVIDSTEDLKLDISLANGAAVTDKDFNVIIVQEATKVLYDENGNPYADWNFVITEESGAKESSAETEESGENTEEGEE